MFGNDRGVLPYTVLIGRDGRILARRAGNFSEARSTRGFRRIFVVRISREFPPNVAELDRSPDARPD